MPVRGVGWARILVVFGLIGVLTAGAVLSPVGARSSLNRRFVKKLVTRRIDALRQELGQSFRETRMNAASSQLVGPFQITGASNDVTVMTLAIPDAGNYVITAKLWWTTVNSTSTGVGGEIDCDMIVGDDFDTSRESGVTDFDYGTMSLQLTHVFSGPGTVVLRCRDEFQGGNPVEVHNVVMTGVEVFALSSNRLDRGSSSDPAPGGVRP